MIVITPTPFELAERELQAYDLDGSVIGTKTGQAISDFQAKAGLPRDGRASASVLAAANGH